MNGFPNSFAVKTSHVKAGLRARSHAPGAVGDLHAGARALPATTLGGRAVASAGATEAGSHGTAIRVRAGHPWGPRTKVPIYSEVPRLGSRYKKDVRKG